MLGGGCCTAHGSHLQTSLTHSTQVLSDCLPGSEDMAEIVDDPLDSGLGGDGEDGPLDRGHHRGLAVRPLAEDGGPGGAGHCLVCVREGARHDGRDPGWVDGGWASQRCSEARVSGGVVI